MKKTVLFFIIFSIFTFVVKGQSAPNKLSLITLQCKSGESICHTQQIVKYNFIKGEYVSKETLLSIDNDKGRFDLGYSFYKNQYIISYSGIFFDTKNKKILGDNRGWVKEIIGDDVIVEVNNINLEGIFKLNLKTNKYTKLKSPNVFELEGELSPDKSKVAVWRNETFTNSSFEFFDVSKDFSYKRAKKVRGSFRAVCSIRCSSSMRVRFVWLDNNKIITQKENGKIISINTSGLIEDIVDLNIEETPDSLPSFSKDEHGNINYYIGGDNYSIFVKNKSFEKNKLDLGNKFYSIEKDGFLSEYFYDGVSINQHWSSSPNSYTGFLVVDYANHGENLGYPKGLLVWNDIKKDWIKIEVDWGVRIIGWLEG